MKILHDNAKGIWEWGFLHTPTSLYNFMFLPTSSKRFQGDQWDSHQLADDSLDEPPNSRN